MGGTILSVGVMGLLGLIIGSFLAAVSVRLPADEDIVMGRSRCMSCDRPLKPWHLVPLVSWLVQRARCAMCGERISPRYPLIEAAAAGIGVWAALAGPALAGPEWPMALATAVLGWQLLLIAVLDAEHFWLPDELTWPLAATGLAAAGWLAGGLPLAQVIGMVFGFGVLWLLAWIYRRVRGREGLGGGDPFLFGAAGAWVGWMGLPSVLLWGCAAGFAVVAARLIVRRRVEATDRLPFGTFLAAGVWLVWLYGPIGM